MRVEHRKKRSEASPEHLDFAVVFVVVVVTAAAEVIVADLFFCYQTQKVSTVSARLILSLMSRIMIDKKQNKTKQNPAKLGMFSVIVFCFVCCFSFMCLFMEGSFYVWGEGGYLLLLLLFC